MISNLLQQSNQVKMVAPPNCIVTECGHVFHLLCLKQWVTQLTKPCPLCNKQIFQPRAGKKFEDLLPIFHKALKEESGIVTHVLEETPQGDACAICQEDFLPLQVMANGENAYQFPIDVVLKVISKCRDKHPQLTSVLSCNPPTPIEIFSHEHPHVAKLLAFGLVTVVTHPSPTLNVVNKITHIVIDFFS